jgi:hypothetical protein
MSTELKELNSYVRHTLSVLAAEGVDVDDFVAEFRIDREALEGQDDQLSQSADSSLLDDLTG